MKWIKILWLLLLMIGSIRAEAQQRYLRGSVDYVDNEGRTPRPAAGVLVGIRGYGLNDVTDDIGSFAIGLPNQLSDGIPITLQVDAEGYRIYEPIGGQHTLQAGRIPLQVTLAPKDALLFWSPAQIQLMITLAREEGRRQGLSERGEQQEDSVNVSIPDFIQGKFYALVIGINNYEGAWEPLYTPVDDARVLVEVLDSRYGFDEIHTLYDEQATETGIIEKLEWFIDNASVDDQVLIYFAGHGDYHDGLEVGYWVPADATTRSFAGYLSNSIIRDYIRSIPAKHVLLVSDACFAGAIFRGNSDAPDTDYDRAYYEGVYKLYTRQAMTSGAIEPVRDKGIGSHSVFNYHLVQALRDNTKSIVAACELFWEYIKGPVAGVTGQTPRCDPIAGAGHGGGEFLLVRQQ